VEIGLAITIKSVFTLINNLFWFFVPVYLIDKGFSGWHVGIFIGLASLISIITTLPAGVANDRIKSKKIIFYSLFFSIIYYFGLITTENVVLLGAAFILGGLGKNLFNISIDSLTFKIIEKKKSSIQIGKYLTGNTVGAILGFIIGGYAIANFGYNNALVGILTLLVILTFGSIFLPITQTIKVKLFEYRKDLFNKEVLFFILIVFLFTLHYGAEATSYSLFLRDNFSLTLDKVGLFIAGANIFLIIGNWIFANKVQKGFDPKKVFYFALVVSGLGHILFSIQSDVWWSFAFRCLHELGDGAMIFSIYYGVVRIFNIERIGGNSSFITLITILSSSIGAFVFGPLGQQYGYYLPLFITGGTNLLAFLMLFYFSKKVLPNRA
jgi:MFS family permease